MPVFRRVAQRHDRKTVHLLSRAMRTIAASAILVAALSISTGRTASAQATATGGNWAGPYDQPDDHDPEHGHRSGRDPAPDTEAAEQPLFQVDASRIRVEFKPGVEAAAAEALVRRYGFVPLDSFVTPDTNALVMLTSSNSAARNPAVYQALSALSKDTHVQRAQLDTTFLPQESGTEAVTHSYMNTQYVFRLIGLGTAQNMSTGGGADIALIDTWVDSQHPAFAHAALTSIDGMAPKSGNGRENNASTAETAAAIYKDHGTRMAGVLAADGPVRGVAPDAGVLLYDVFAPTQSGTTTASGYYIAKSLSDAVSRNVDVVNISLCGPYDGLISRVIATALQKQVNIVAAAGNGGPLARACYPAAADGVIAVTATDADDHLYEHANRGSYITMAAPGVDILTAASHGKLGIATGTSFAAAHVTGMVALLRSRHPDLSADAIVKILSYSAKDMGPKGRDPDYGVGRLSALEAMILSDQDLTEYEAFPAP